jgi:hypothetical protein
MVPQFSPVVRMLDKFAFRIPTERPFVVGGVPDHGVPHGLQRFTLRGYLSETLVIHFVLAMNNK